MPDALSFDANTVAPRSAFDVIPAGWYRAWITESEMKPTAKGGEYLQLVWEILDGEQAKRKVWDRLNLKNASATAVDIAQASLSAICHAAGVMRIQHTGQLHGKPCLIKVGIEKSVGYSDKNKIVGYLKDGDPKAKVSTLKVGAGASGAVSGRGAALVDDDSDLPF